MFSIPGKNMDSYFRQAAAGLVLTFGMVLIAGHAVGAEGVAASLRQALEEAGWQAKRQADGTVELHMNVSTTEGEGGIEGETEAVSKPSSLDAVPVAEGAVSIVWDRLRDGGWRVESASDGSTLLYPPVPEKAAENTPLPDDPSGETPLAVTELEPALASEKGLDDYLEERGWRVARTPDGSLLLFPQTKTAPLASKAPPEPCAGVVPAPVSQGDVALPVDRWDEAKNISESWLASVDSPDSVVGRIRRIFGVFVVSIVDTRPPHRLKHQIAINADDGRVMVLN